MRLKTQHLKTNRIRSVTELNHQKTPALDITIQILPKNTARLKDDELLIIQSHSSAKHDTLHPSLPFWMNLDKSNRTFSYKLRSCCRGSIWPVDFFQGDCETWQRGNISSLLKIGLINLEAPVAWAQSWHAHEGISKLQSSGPMPISSVNTDHSPSVPNAPPQWNPATAPGGVRETERHPHNASL